MKKSITTLPFKDTEEQAKELDEILARYKDVPGGIMPVLQETQRIYGYLPYEVQKKISEDMDVKMEEIYGIATFYSQFSLTPKGQYDISVCLGTACYVKGSGDILNEISKLLGIGTDECTADGKFSISSCRCIGCCGLAPVMTVNGEVYGRLEVKDVKGILEKYDDEFFSKAN
ncbi:NADH-quinone oxidoreductase subunit NuoE family protein [Anaeropeptidivorans aminofermentans]|uniref:NADH-quinone oxidoreductase subunit NuoE family protein n=1 Tax=Anaeropeptidivorans aminofermentans TaxID=2934315 RepID=UPI002025976F|nr:NAD(P)H-dependent oxidoreductase subunit E [Anaeropeptidivorans aminofermentans]